MSVFREEKRRMRQTVHETLGDWVVLWRKTDPSLEPLQLRCRNHYRFMATGDMQGTSLAYAETLEQLPHCIFMVEELGTWELRKGDYIVFAKDRVLVVDTTQPRDDITVKARVVEVGKSELANTDWPLPVEI